MNKKISEYCGTFAPGEQRECGGGFSPFEGAPLLK